jgi:hypothetical protein
MGLPVGDASRCHLSGRCGLFGGDVANPAPTSLNEGRGEGDVGAEVLHLGSSSSAFGDGMALQLNGELRWQLWQSVER